MMTETVTPADLRERDPKEWRCPHDMGMDAENGPLGCRLNAVNLECVCLDRHSYAVSSGNHKSET